MKSKHRSWTLLLVAATCAISLDVAARPDDDDAPAKKKKRTREPTQWIVKNDDTHEDRQLDLLANLAVLGTGTGGGLAIWVSFPVAPEGFIPNVNDEFSIEVGSYFQYYSWSAKQSFGFDSLECSQNWWVVAPLVGVRWSFYLTEAWRIYPKLKMGYAIGVSDKHKCEFANGGAVTTQEISGPSISHFGWEVGLGAYWRFSESLALRMEFTNFGPAAGLSVDF